MASHHPCCQDSYGKDLALSSLKHVYLEPGCLKRPLMKWIELVPNPSGYCKMLKSDRLTKESVARNRETSTCKPQKEDSGGINPGTSSSQTSVFFFLWEDKYIKLPSLSYFVIMFLEKYVSTCSRYEWSVVTVFGKLLIYRVQSTLEQLAWWITWPICETLV